MATTEERARELLDVIMTAMLTNDNESLTHGLVELRQSPELSFEVALAAICLGCGLYSAIGSQTGLDVVSLWRHRLLGQALERS